MLNKISDKILWVAGILLVLSVLVIGWQQGSLPMTTMAGIVLGLISGMLIVWLYVDYKITTPEETKARRARRERRHK